MLNEVKHLVLKKGGISRYLTTFGLTWVIERMLRIAQHDVGD